MWIPSCWTQATVGCDGERRGVHQHGAYPRGCRENRMGDGCHLGILSAEVSNSGWEDDVYEPEFLQSQAEPGDELPQQ